MKVVSVINYKGGVGKTATTANLGAELAWRGKKVLLLDMDPQASLTFSFIRPEDWQQKYAESHTIKDWYDSIAKGDPKSLSSLIIEPADVKSWLAGKGKLHLISSHLGLLNVDLELATELGGATLRQAKQNFFRVHGRLAAGLAAIPPDQFDVVLIDCPPNFNIVTRNAIVASEKILVPAKPDYLSTIGIDFLMRSVSGLIQEYNDYSQVGGEEDTQHISPSILGVVFTMVQYHGGQPISAIRPFIRQTAALGVPVFDAQIRENKTVFADAPQYGVPVVLHQYQSQSHERVVDGLEQFVTEFAAKLGL